MTPDVLHLTNDWHAEIARAPISTRSIAMVRHALNAALEGGASAPELGYPSEFDVITDEIHAVRVNGQMFQFIETSKGDHTYFVAQKVAS